MFDLSGRTALVTGAGQNVGGAIARALAAQGAAVAVNDLSEDRAQATVDDIVAKGGRAVTAVADVTAPDAVASMVTAVAAALGPVDILVNNAGVPPTGLRVKQFAETTPDDWAPVVALNLYGVLHCVRAVIGDMTERGWGRIVTISSDAARVGEPGFALYGAAKAGAAGFMRSLAKEVGPAGVTCNCVSLGSIAPPDGDDDPQVAKRAARYPVRRLGRGDDVAATVVWLASEEAAWVTGQTVPVNGGYVVL